jgi:flagellar hook protein FlgE
MSNIQLTAVSGLKVHQEMLDVVGNNLANVNTTGFKSQRVRFSDLVYQTLKPAAGGNSDSLGGTNPVQVGLGVQVAAVDSDLEQGTLESTGQELDMALQGQGYFVVNNGVQDVFTRAGAFGVDGDKHLVDPATGARVQRTGTVGEGSATSPAFQTPGSSDITIPYGSVLPGRATTSVTMQGNLPASAQGPQAQTLTSVAAFKTGGAPATAATLLNSLDDTTTPYVAGDQIRIQGTTSSGTAVNTTLAVGPTTTLGDVLNAVNAAFPGSTATLDASGNLVVQSSTTGPSSLSLLLGDAAGNTGRTSWSNHALTVTTTGKDGDTATTGIQIFDKQGIAHTFSLVFQKQGNNTWNLTGSIPPGEGTMIDNSVTGITFNDDGSFRGVTGLGTGDAMMTIAFPNLAAPQQISLSFGTTNKFDGLTQVGGESSAAATGQDGFVAGFLNSVEVGKDGIINGVFTNGRVLPLAQLAIATFANPGALSRESQNYYSLTSESGPALVGSGLSGGRGTVLQRTLENSNVDVALEFTKLIIAQRGFEVNAKAITTANEVQQDLANIIR